MKLSFITKSVFAVMNFALLTACGQATDERTGSGTFTYSAEDTFLTVTIPAPPDHSDLQRIEDYRTKGNADAPHYLLAELKQGNSPAPWKFIVVTTEGHQVTFEEAMHLISEWSDTSGTEDREFYNEGVRLYNSLLQSKLGTALPGASMTAIYATNNSIGEISTVWLIDTDFNRIQMKRQ